MPWEYINEPRTRLDPGHPNFWGDVRLAARSEFASEERQMVGTTGGGRVSAALLAGGQSRRMGQDKALLRVRPDDPPLAQIVIERLRAVADEVFVVASDRPAYARFGVPVVPDDHPGTGALGGIATAVRQAEHEACIVVACDLPFLSSELLAWMAGQRAGWDVVIPRLPGRSRQGGELVFHTLHAIYGRSCLPAIRRRMDDGRYQVIGFFDDVRVRPVTEAEVSAIDPELRSFFNVNTPEAAAVARRWLEEGAGRT